MPNGSSLAPFSSHWIGGDIRGLQGIAETLYAYLPCLQDLTGTLSATARDLTNDGPDGWRGQAASAFTAAWQKQVKTAAALEDYVTGIAHVVDKLAGELSKLENALEEQAYEVSKHGVRIGNDGSVQGYDGVHGLEAAESYSQVRKQALDEAEQARAAAAHQLYSLYEKVTNENPHPTAADAVTMGGLLADLLAVPTASRREVTTKLKGLKGRSLKLDQEIRDARRAGKAVQEVVDESTKAERELQQVQEELAKTGRTESLLSKLLDTRVRDVNARMEGAAGPGRHVAGNTPADLQAVADHEPGAIEKILNAGKNIPGVDVVSTVAGTAVGTYYDVKGGQSLGSALRDEAASNTAGAIAANASASLVGTEIGSRLGAAGGPVGIVAGAVVGYGVGDSLTTSRWRTGRRTSTTTACSTESWTALGTARTRPPTTPASSSSAPGTRSSAN